MTRAEPQFFDVEITPAQAGARVDLALTTTLATCGTPLSRSRIQALIEAGHVVRLDARGTVVEAARRVKPGEHYRLTLPPPAPATPQAQPRALAIVYEDDDLIVIDKPAGLVVHPAPGNPDRTLVNALIAHCGVSLSGIGGVIRPGIVHRLDKDTSGLLIAAKTDLAHQGLAAQFAAHGRDGRLHRAYHAFVWGRVSRAQGTVDAPIGRNPKNRKSFAVTPGGKPAVTHYRVLAWMGEKARPVTLIECRLETGRTHQIRVHLADLGHPLLGDPLYGGRRNLGGSATAAVLQALGRQALHAAELGFVHPRTAESLLFFSPLPPPLADLRFKLEEL